MNVGDKVVVVNYGHRIWTSENGRFWQMDISPDIIGQKGMIVKKEQHQNLTQYAVNGPDKHAWYNEDQLELIP